MENNRILIVCDTQLYDERHTLQMVYKAKTLAKADNKEVTVALVGLFKEEIKSKIFDYGADRIVVYKTDLEIADNVFANIIFKIIELYPPELILMPASELGKTTAATLSVRLDAGLTADCIEIELQDNYYFSRAAINDSVIAKIKCINCSIQMCTVKKDVFALPDDIYLSARSAGIVETLNLNEIQEKINKVPKTLEIISKVKMDTTEVTDIHKYALVFCVGRGVRQNNLLRRIRCIAEKCGACIVGTRAAVEDNLIEKEYQIGQSGRNISPQIYIGFGVSGASQHMVGIKNAGTIIAINQDPRAPIFQYADYSIIGDVEEIINELEKQLIVKLDNDISKTFRV